MDSGTDGTNPHVLMFMLTTHTNADMQLHAHLQFSLQVAVWIRVMKYSFCVATSMETKPWRTLQYVLYVKGSLSFSFSASFFSYCQACFVDCFSSACCPFYLSVCSLSFSLSFSSPSLSLGTVWLVRPVIELPLFDQGSNRNCTLLTQLCRYACVCACVRIFQEGACHCVWLCI